MEKIICKECKTENAIDPERIFFETDIIDRNCIACGYCLDCGKWKSENCETCKDK